MTRKVISGPAMYALLIREFARLRPAECKRCSIPLPFWGPAAGVSNSVYWYMPSSPPCVHQCHHIIAELWATVTTEYEIAAPGTRMPRQTEVQSSP
jgi:hypothetical protein